MTDSSCRRFRVLLPFALAASAFGARAQSPAYADRPIRMIVPWNVGGGTDAVTRAFATALDAELGQKIVVDNKPGANGIIGTTAVATAKPDGLTVGIASAETHAINPYVYGHLPYDPEQFEAIGLIGDFPYALAVRPSLEAQNLGDLIELAKKEPGKLSYASWGVGSSSQIAFELFRQTAGIDMLHVPFTGAGPALAALIGDQVDALMVPLSVAEPQWRAGKLKILALGSAERMDVAPDLPTLIEQGVDVTGGTWLVLVGPKGTPREVVERLNEATNAVLAQESLRRTLAKMGVVPGGGSPAEVDAMLESERERWGAVVRTAGIKLD